MARHKTWDECDFVGAQALAVGNITEEFVDPGTVNTQVNCKTVMLYVYWGVPQKHVFQKLHKRKSPRISISLGISLQGSKRIFDFD